MATRVAILTMSNVLKANRGETKLDVLVKARYLCTYTIEITSNEKVFKPQFQQVITNDIVKTSKDIFIHLFEANNIDIRPNNPNLKTDYELRRSLITQSIRDCYNLLALMQIAQKLFHLSSKRIAYWGKQTIEVRDMARKLRDSDRNRLADKL